MVIVSDIPCPFCGCLCDDLELTVAEGRIVAADRACEIARSQFMAVGESPLPACRVGGQPAELADGIRSAAELLRAARYPLVWGLGRATCEAQSEAVRIAEQLGGVIDVPGGADDAAVQTIGELTCTLGEIRRRADRIVIWCADPLTTHPRFLERYTPGEISTPTSETEGACRLFAVDSRQTPTSDLARMDLRIQPGREFEAATVLRALVKRIALDDTQVAAQTGVPLGDWRALFEQMTQARYGVIVYAIESAADSIPPLHALVRSLADRARWVCIGLPAAANSVGAGSVLTWRTGYPRAVDFSRGYPRYDPRNFSAERLLERGEVDAALVICDDPQERLSAAAVAQLRRIPTVVVDWRETATLAAANVALAASVPGVESPGTMFRLDGVPLALRPALPPRHPADFERLRALAEALK